MRARLGARFAGRSVREGVDLGATALLLLATGVGVNYVADRRNLSWDTTPEGIHSLAPQTLQVLADLDREVRLVVLDQPRAAGPTIELFESYADQTDRIVWEVIDPEADPVRAGAYQASAEAGIPFGTVVVAAADRQERVAAPQEQDITNAIVRLLKGETKKIYFTTGHQEPSLEETGAGGLAAIRSRLEESNYEVEELPLLASVEAGEVTLPEDAAVVIVAGPRRDLLPEEAEALSTHVRSGGKLMLLLDPPEPPDLEDQRTALLDLAGEFGVPPAGDVVLDASGVGQLFGFGIEVPLAASYGFHAITRGFETSATVFPLAQSLIPAAFEERPEGTQAYELVLTSEASWGERNGAELESGEVTPDEADRTGPLTLAVAVTVTTGEPAPDNAGPDGSPADGRLEDPGGPEDPQEAGPAASPEPEGRLVVVGDSDFVTNNLALAPLGNADLFLNMVSWLAEDEDLIAIRPRDPEDRRITMTAAQLRNTVLFSLVFLPGFWLIWGLAVWWSRR